MTTESLYMNAAYENLVDIYADTVTRLCILRLKNLPDAEDCWQNVFLKLYKAEKMWNKPPDELRRWIITVTLNECRDFSRKLFHRNHDSIDELNIPYYEDFDKNLITTVKNLPHKYSQVLYLHYFEGYGVQEISKILGTRENTIKSQLVRGRKLLKGAFENGLF